MSLFKVTKLDNGRTRRKERKRLKKIQEKEKIEIAKKLKREKRAEVRKKKIEAEEQKERNYWKNPPKKEKNIRYGIIDNKINRERIVAGKKPLAVTIDISKALQLRIEKRMTYADIGQYFGCSSSTVTKHLKPYLNLLNNPADLAIYNSHKSKFLDAAELKLLNKVVDDDKLDSATLQQTASALNIVSNIGRLEKGLSTDNVSFLDMSESLEKLKQKKAQLKETLGLDDKEK